MVYPAAVVTLLAAVHAVALAVVCCSNTAMSWPGIALGTVLAVVAGRLLLDAGLQSCRTWLSDDAPQTSATRDGTTGPGQLPASQPRVSPFLLDSK